MTDMYRQLLAAAIAHLEELRAHGTRYVAVAPEALAALAAPRAVTPRSPAAPHPAPSAAQSAAVRPERPAPGRGPPTPPAAADRVGAAPATAPPAAAQGALAVEGGPPAPLTREAKEAAMAALRARALACVKCAHLVKARQNVVFGVGDIHSPLMFVGEAPGADEDAQGEPFVGLAGQLLTKIIQTMGFSRSSVYIANILKCRPDTPGRTSGNRKPTPAEMATCAPYLLEQIDLIQPKVIVALGATAVEGLLGKTEGITRLRGQWRVFRGIPLMPTYHPAYLLRNQALSEKRKVWEDLLLVLEKLGMPGSEKQRGYFLRG
jgi:DNA polymerase